MKFLKRLMCPHSTMKKILFFKIAYSYDEYIVSRHIFSECKDCNKVRIAQTGGVAVFSSKQKAIDYTNSLNSRGFMSESEYEVERYLKEGGKS